MEGKKSFVLYADLIDLVKELPIEKRGELFTIILEYVNDLDPQIKDPLLRVAFTPIKQALKRDLAKWQGIVERNRENGSKGGRPQKNLPKNDNQDKPKKPSGLSGNPDKPKKADSVSVTVNATAIENATNTSKVGITRFENLFSKKEFLKEMEFKGYLYYDLRRDFKRFCSLNEHKEFDNEDHFRNTLIKFLGAKTRVSYSESENKYLDQLLKSVDPKSNGKTISSMLNEAGLNPEDWGNIYKEFERYAISRHPALENEQHGWNIFREFMENQVPHSQ